MEQRLLLLPVFRSHDRTPRYPDASKRNISFILKRYPENTPICLLQEFLQAPCLSEESKVLVGTQMCQEKEINENYDK